MGNGGSSAGNDGQAGDDSVAGEGGEGGEAGSPTAGTGGSSAGASGSGAGNGGSVAGAGGAAAGNGGSNAGGSAGSVGTGGSVGTAGSVGNTAGSGGAGGSGGTSGSAGAGGAPVVLVPNCVRDTTSGKRLKISAAGNDGLFAAAYRNDGVLYAAGYTQAGVGALEDRSTVVVRFTAAGAIDATWAPASNGVVTVNAKLMASGLGGLAELPRGLAFQGNKVIVAGTVEAYSTAQSQTALNNDRDVYVLRLNEDGTLDTTFGENGIRILSLNEGTLVTNATTGAVTLSGADAQWGLNVLPNNKIIVTAAARASGFQADGTTPRSDTDFAVVRLTENGAKDTTFGLNASGVFTLDVAQASASVRTASVLSDGKLIVTGYASYGGTQRPVIFKLLADGSALDSSFASNGVFSEPVGTAAEAYGALVQSTGANANKLVTVGYGRATSANTTSDMLSIRLTAGGVLDTTYGATATPGRAWFDVGGLGDNGRAIVLSEDRPVLLGGGSLSNGQQDGVVALLTVDGKPSTTAFGSPYGCVAYDFGTVGDFFWSGAVHPTNGTIAAVGLTGNASGSTDDTDGILALINKP